MTGCPVAKHTSIAACTSAYSASGNDSLTGIPRPSLGVSARTSSLHHSMTWYRPRKSATAAPIVVLWRSLNDAPMQGIVNAGYDRYVDASGFGLRGAESGVRLPEPSMVRGGRDNSASQR